MIVVFLIILIQLIGYPVVVMRLTHSIVKKDKLAIKKYCCWLLGLFIFSGMAFEKLPGSQLLWWPIERIESKFYTKRITGHSFFLSEPLYESHSKRAFNGDGRSIQIYDLSKGVKDNFTNPDSMFFKNYPKQEFFSDWSVVHWAHTPIKLEHEDAYHFASYANNQSEYKLDELLHESGNYYAFKYYDHSPSGGLDNIRNVEFYLLSPKRNILITINVDT